VVIAADARRPVGLSPCARPFQGAHDRAEYDDESAFNVAPLHTSLPGITAAAPAAGIVLGIVALRATAPLCPGSHPSLEPPA
jgi:hypothetical protein